MKNYIIQVLVLILTCIFVLAAARAEDRKEARKPEVRDVFMYNILTKEIRTNCIESLGKHDYKPCYECPESNTDAETKKQPVDLGTNWKVVYPIPICMQKKGSGRIRSNCKKCEISEGNDLKTYYFCPDKQSGKYLRMPSSWKPLPLDHPLCKPTEPDKDGGIKDDGIRNL